MKRPQPEQAPERVADARTRLKKKAFLEAYVTIGNVTYAARAAGVLRQLHYDWIKEDEAYAADFVSAQEQAIETMEQEARRRAVEGIDKPIYHKGLKIDTIKEYSDVLLIFLLKGAKPAMYRERVEHAGPGGGPIQHEHDLTKLSKEEVETLRALVVKAQC